MRVEEKLARPRVEYGRQSELSAEVPLFAAELEEGLRRAREEHAEERFAAKAHECT